MKIALFSDTYLPQINGVATHVKTLKEGMEELGHQVMVVTADSKVRFHSLEEGVLRCPATELKDLYGYGMAPTYNQERMRLLRAFSPDIVHIHTEFGIGSTGLELARELSVPLIYTQHTMWDEYLHYVASPTLLPTVRKLAHAYFRYFANQADAVIGPSQKVQTFLDACGAKRKVEVIPNAVELDRFSMEQVDKGNVELIRQTYGFQPSDLIICFCGRLAQEKSVDVLLDYFAVCHQEDCHIKLMLMGDGPARAALEGRARYLGISDAVVFTGSIPHDSVRDVYAYCDLYATASRSELHSISMLEAMAMGLPVLHILDEANAGQVVDGVNGYVFANARELRAHILRYRDSSEDEKQQLRASATASVRFADQIGMAQKIESIYQRHVKQEAALMAETGKGGGPYAIP